MKPAICIWIGVISSMLLGRIDGQDLSPDSPRAQGRVEVSKAASVESILRLVQDKAKDLRTFKADVDYVIEQPLLESKIRRKGSMWYSKGPQGSLLRVNFDTEQQDEEPFKSNKQQFLFNGVWLTTLDYQVKSIQKRQLAEPNKPMDAFELAGQELPILGFTSSQDLGKDFEITQGESLGQAEPNTVRLVLKTKPGSRYRDDYMMLEFWVDCNMGLPVRVDAKSVKDEVYRLRFLDPNVNGPMDGRIFQMDAPEGFGELETIPLKPGAPRGPMGW